MGYLRSHKFFLLGLVVGFVAGWVVIAVSPLDGVPAFMVSIGLSIMCGSVGTLRDARRD